MPFAYEFVPTVVEAAPSCLPAAGLKPYVLNSDPFVSPISTSAPRLCAPISIDPALAKEFVPMAIPSGRFSFASVLPAMV